MSMAGRGRGRKKGNPVVPGGLSLTFNLRAVGLTKSELPRANPAAIANKGLYPDIDTERRAGPLPSETPLDTNLIETDSRLELRFQESIYYQNVPSTSAQQQKHLQRYGDKYDSIRNADSSRASKAAYDPAESYLIKSDFSAVRDRRMKPGTKKRSLDEDNIKTRLLTLEEKESFLESNKRSKLKGDSPSKEVSAEKAEGDEENHQEVDQDQLMTYEEEEEVEEGLDYLVDYFDNGEDYLEDDDDGNEGPLY